MPKVTVEAPDHPAVEIDAPAGGRLLDLCDEARAPVPFSCRSASCGTCRVEVLEGAALLDEPGDDEQETLEAFGDGPTRRLACVARVAEGPGQLRLRLVDD